MSRHLEHFPIHKNIDVIHAAAAQITCSNLPVPHKEIDKPHSKGFSEYWRTDSHLNLLLHDILFSGLT